MPAELKADFKGFLFLLRILLILLRIRLYAVIPGFTLRAGFARIAVCRGEWILLRLLLLGLFLQVWFRLPVGITVRVRLRLRDGVWFRIQLRDCFRIGLFAAGAGVGDIPVFRAGRLCHRWDIVMPFRAGISFLCEYACRQQTQHQHDAQQYCKITF